MNKVYKYVGILFNNFSKHICILTWLRSIKTDNFLRNFLFSTFEKLNKSFDFVTPFDRLYTRMIFICPLFWQILVTSLTCSRASLSPCSYSEKMCWVRGLMITWFDLNARISISEALRNVCFPLRGCFC